MNSQPCPTPKHNLKSHPLRKPDQRTQIAEKPILQLCLGRDPGQQPCPTVEHIPYPQVTKEPEEMTLGSLAAQPTVLPSHRAQSASPPIFRAQLAAPPEHGVQPAAPSTWESQCETPPDQEGSWSPSHNYPVMVSNQWHYYVREHSLQPHLTRVDCRASGLT